MKDSIRWNTEGCSWRNTLQSSTTSIWVGVKETNEQITCYLTGLNQSIRDEIGVVRLFNLEDARQYALMAEKWVPGYLCLEELRCNTNGLNNCLGCSYRPNNSKIDWDNTIMNWKLRRNISNASSKASSRSQVPCFMRGEKRHRICMPTMAGELDIKEVLLKPKYDDYDDGEGDPDLYPLEREYLVLWRMIPTRKVEEQDWRRHNNFWTRVFWGIDIYKMFPMVTSFMNFG